MKMENLNVYIYLKSTNEKKDNKSESFFTYDSKTITNLKTNKNITFDSILTSSMTNKEIFEKIIKRNITNTEILKGINISLILYGQTGTGKTYIMKGDTIKNEGIIPLTIKEVFNSLNKKDSSISKYIVKISYIEIYNEIINDLIDTSKKNLDIKEEQNKRTYVHNASEFTAENAEKAIQIYNIGELNRTNGEAKMNEKSNKNNLIFRIILELYIKDKKCKKEKKLYTQINLIELAGSENINKIKNEGILNKDKDINKSIIAFNNIINKLSHSNGNKNLINFKESKLTRLLQHSLISGDANTNTNINTNSKSIKKTSIICTILDDNNNYCENMNTLHFAMRVKNIKNNIKVNYNTNAIKGIEDKKIKENQALRNKIKFLEKIINDKKGLKDKKKDNNNDNNNNKNNSKLNIKTKLNNSNNEANSTIDSGNKIDIQNNEQILNLEKEVSLLKKYLMNNEEMDPDMTFFQDEAEWMNFQGDNDTINMNMNSTSAYKPSFYNNIGNLSAIRGSESAIKSTTFFNSPCLLRQQQFEFNNNNTNKMNNNNFRKNICLTEMRPEPFEPKNFFHSAIRYTAPHNNNNYNNNFLFGSNYKFSMPDLNNLNNLNNTNVDIGNNYLEKENEELKNNIYELKKTYNEIVQSKEDQIKLLNQNHDMTLENCEKLIKEAETNYNNLKSQYDQIIVKMKNADDEMNELKQKNINQDTSITYYKKELNKVNDFNYANEMEAKCNSLIEENTKLKQKDEGEATRLKEENELLRKNIDMIDNKYKEKCKQLNDKQKMINEVKKKHEKELKKYKIEIKNFKNIIPKGKNITGNIDNNININNEKVKEYENKINKLIMENNIYKNNLENIEKTQIVEYQKLLDDSFSKIAQLNQEIIDYKDKNKYLERALNIIEKNSTKNKKEINNIIELNEDNNNMIRNKDNYNNYSKKKNEKNNLDEENKVFLNKKRKEISTNNNSNQTPNKENKNILNTEFSNFEI